MAPKKVKADKVEATTSDLKPDMPVMVDSDDETVDVVEKKEVKAEKKEKPAKVKSAEAKTDDPASDHSSDVSENTKRQRKVSLEKMLALLKSNEVDKVIRALENEIKVKGDKKPRAPSLFNQFVKETMARMKKEGSTMNTNEKMKECSRLWNERKAAAA